MAAAENNPPAPAAAAPAPAVAPVQSETKKVTTIATNTSSTEDAPWQDLRLPEKFGEILKIGCKVDCKFIVGPETDKAEIIFGHKWMFAVESPVFERMFCGDFMEAKDGTAIRLPDDDPGAFRNLRRMLYNTRSCQMEYLNFDDTITLYRLCDKYMVTSIKKLCIDHIKQFYEKITDTQLITLFAVTNELQNLEILNDVKEKLLAKKYPLIEDLNNLNVIQFVEYVQLYLTNNGTDANHLDLFNTIETYLTHHQLIPQALLEDSQNKRSPTTRLDGQAEKEIKRELLERLLACVDFGKIETDKFLAGPGISKILTWQQKYFIVSQLSTLPCEKCNNGKQEITIKVYESA